MQQDRHKALSHIQRRKDRPMENLENMEEIETL